MSALDGVGDSVGELRCPAPKDSLWGGEEREIERYRGKEGIRRVEREADELCADAVIRSRSEFSMLA